MGRQLSGTTSRFITSHTRKVGRSMTVETLSMQKSWMRRLVNWRWDRILSQRFSQVHIGSLITMSRRDTLLFPAGHQRRREKVACAAQGEALTVLACGSSPDNELATSSSCRKSEASLKRKALT